MGRISTIESTAASGLPRYNNLKVVVRGRPRFIDPQLDGGTLRFAVKRGFNFSAIIPDNQAEISQDVYKDSYRITMSSRPTWMGMGTLIRLGSSEVIGELHIVQDTIDLDAVDVYEPIISNYSATQDQSTIPVVSLVGTPCNVYAPTEFPDSKKIMTIDSWYKIVPSDKLLMSGTPDVLESFEEYEVKRADFFGTREGNEGIGEPAILYQYHIELNTKTGLLPFIPSVGLKLYLRAQPLYFRGEWGVGDLEIPPDVGPCVLDAFFGSLLESNDVGTQLGIQTWDAFGQQANLAEAENQQWQKIPENFLMLERPITSDSLLFWQRITGDFQYQKKGYFQAELSDEGKFCFSSNLLVPKWPSDREYGWVIPLFSRSAVRCVFQFEPQEPQIFEIPSNTLTFIRPHVKKVYNTIASGVIPFVAMGDTILTTDFVVTFNPTTNQCTSNVEHGFLSGAKIRFSTLGSLPSGISTQTDYFVVTDSPTEFRLSDTVEKAKAGISTIVITEIGSGMHRCTNPNINLISLGIKKGHYLSSSNLLLKIMNVTNRTVTIESAYPLSVTALSYSALKQDLTPIDRILISFKGSPNSRVEIRDWQYDGTIVSSLSYYILGTKEAYGQKRWLAGGFCVKPLFYNLAILRARYSDGVSRYNAGHTYV